MAANDLNAVLLESRPALIRFLRARGATDDAEDIVQDLWLKLSGIDVATLRDPIAFLYRAADNLLLDRRRANARSGKRDLAWQKITSADDGERDDKPTAEDTLIIREQLGLVEQRLAALGERTAAIFRRFRIEGRGQREIAAEERISVSAVEKHLRRCYRLLASIRDAADEESGTARRQEIEGANDVRR